MDSTLAQLLTHLVNLQIENQNLHKKIQELEDTMKTYVSSNKPQEVKKDGK